MVNEGHRASKESLGRWEEKAYRDRQGHRVSGDLEDIVDEMEIQEKTGRQAQLEIPGPRGYPGSGGGGDQNAPPPSRLNPPSGETPSS